MLRHKIAVQSMIHSKCEKIKMILGLISGVVVGVDFGFRWKW